MKGAAIMLFKKRSVKYIDTKGYFKNSELYQNLVGNNPVINKMALNKILEIGAYEGVGTCYFCDHFLDHPESLMATVDPFIVEDPGTAMHVNVERNFLNNIARVKNLEKLIYVKDKSVNFFLRSQSKFNFIYVDGSHHPLDLRADMENAVKILEVGGVLWVDDYGSNYTVDSIRPKNVIDEFYSEKKNELSLIHSGYQIAFKKL